MKVHEHEASGNIYYQKLGSDQRRALTVTLEHALRPRESLAGASNAATWSETVATFLAAAIDSEGTRRAYARHLKRAGQLLGVEYVFELTGSDLTGYRVAVMSAGLAPASQAQALSALRSFLNWSGSMGAHRLPATVVALALRTPSATVKVRYAVINEREIVAILEAAPGRRERAILAVLLGAGLRVAEAANLAVDDIVEDLDGVALHVRQGKGRKDRMVPIGPEVDGLLRDYLVATGRYLGGEGSLFLATDRGAKSRKAGLSTRAIARMVGAIALAAGIAAKRVTPHSLRHTYAIRCLRAGGNVVAVARLLGHARIATTQRYVDHLAVSELRATVPPLPMGGVHTGAASEPSSAGGEVSS